MFIGRTNAKAETAIFGHLIQRMDSFEKTLMLEKLEGRRRRGTTEDEMVGWHHRLNGHELSKLQELMIDRDEKIIIKAHGAFENDFLLCLIFIIHTKTCI